MTNIWLLALLLFVSETALMFLLDRIDAVAAGSISRNLLDGFLLALIMLPLFHLMKRGATALDQEKQLLLENEERLRQLGDNLPDGFIYQVMQDAEGTARFLYISAGVEALTGITVEEALGDANALRGQIDPAQVPLLIEMETACVRDLSNFEMEARILRRDGEWRWLQIKSRPRRLPDGRIVWDGVAFNISARKAVESQLHLAARVFSEAHEGIIITDTTAAIVDVNPTFRDITGYSREEVLGKNPSLLASGKQSAEFFAAMWDTLNRGGYWQGELWNRKKSGELFAERLTISALRDEHGQVVNYLGLFSDITQTKQQQQTLELMAHYDVLTQLPNRVLFADRFAQAIAHGRRENTLLAVCYLDLDGFKQVNDTMGHEAGDRLLIEVANRIKITLRREDTVSRLGGDEFALLLGDIGSLDQCEQALARIIHTLAQPHLLDGQMVSISASIGVTIYPLDEADPDTLLRHADQAMYQAKLNGRNRYHLFDTSRDRQAKNRQQLMDEIRQALVRGELCLYYQPKVNMRSGDVLGAEALLRWHHPERGILLPTQFLSLIEGTALEITIGNWVIEEALKRLEYWKAQGLELQVSVNISSNHLQWNGFFTQLEAALARHPDIASRQLELEVLESSVPGDLAAVGEIIRGCHNALGVSIALDDFGTGYSSLTQLRHLPTNTIKIDQSFVRDMIDDPNDFAIVSGVVGLANAFRRDVVAEGVETMEHGLVLLTMGCAYGQGIGIARPMPADMLASWARAYQPWPEWKNYAASRPDFTTEQLLLVKIESDQWLRRMEECLKSNPGAAVHWPIMDYKRCHCGRWVEQARRDRLFEPELLDRLDLAHEDLHHVGITLMHQFLDGQVEQARAGLENLHAAYRVVRGILREHCEKLS